MLLVGFAIFLACGVAALADALGKNAAYWFFVTAVFTPLLTLPALGYVVVTDAGAPIRKAPDGSTYPARVQRSAPRMALGIGFALIVALSVATMVGVLLGSSV